MPFRIARAFLILLGALIAVAALAIDYLLPNASPGLNLPQILAIAVGLALAMAALRWRRSGKVAESPPGGALALAKPAGKKRVAGAALVSLVTFLALEAVLTLGGYPTYFPAGVSAPDFADEGSRPVCENPGCRLYYEAVQPACATGQLSGRFCKVNRQGYTDSDDFVVNETYANRSRVLMLGDSFTQGFSADVGRSFVELLESAFPEAVVWNTALAATGTRQDLAAFREFAPDLRPHLTILGFCMNDFANNLGHLDQVPHWLDGSGNLVFIPDEHIDRWGNPVKIPWETVYAYALLDSPPPASELERATGLTRLGSLLLRALDRFGKLMVKPDNLQVRLTRQYLLELTEAVATIDSRLLVVLVPNIEDFDDLGERYEIAKQLMSELGIPYISTIETLDPAADYAPMPDGHWNNAGHQKVGKLLSACVASFFANGDFDSCAGLAMPSN